MFFRKKCVFSPNFLLPAKTPFFRGENRRKRRKTNGQNGVGGNGTGRKNGKDGRQGVKNRRRKTERVQGGCERNRAGAVKERACEKQSKQDRSGTDGAAADRCGKKQGKCGRRRQVIIRNGKCAARQITTRDEQRAAAPDYTPQRTMCGYGITRNGQRKKTRLLQKSCKSPHRLLQLFIIPPIQFSPMPAIPSMAARSFSNAFSADA